MFTRKDYLAADRGTGAHRKYYAQLVTPGLLRLVESAFTIKRLKEAYAKDEHFNSIPLIQWDNLSSIISMNVSSSKIKELGDYWTLSGLVCVAKEAALQLVEIATEKENS